MIFAQVKSGVISNIIVLDDLTLCPIFLEGFDYLIRIDEMNPYPTVGFLYDGQNFSPPPEES